MTHTEELTVDNITVSNKIIIPIFTYPDQPTNPLQGQIYIKKQLNAAIPYELMIYSDGAWN